MFSTLATGQIKNQSPTQKAMPKSFAPDDNETLVYKALGQIVGAQVTYSMITGNGNYAVTLQELADFEYADQISGKSKKLELIDRILGRGERYGYYFWVTATPGKNNHPAFFTATATPGQYLKTGRRSFYTDSTGVIRSADKNGAIAAATDPFFLICGESEWEAFQFLRTLHSAEVTYQSSFGNGNFGTLKTLQTNNLIDPALAEGNRCGYRFTVVTTTGFADNPASFYIAAVPQKYPAAGRRSFRIDFDGIIRGGDKQGAIAAVKDSIIPAICGESEWEAAQFLRILHGAEITYQAVSVNGNFGSLSDLQSKNLIDLPMLQGDRCGYRFILTTIEGKTDHPATFNIIATPKKYGETGRHSFYLNEQGVIRSADRHGQPADPADLPIDFQN